MHSGRHQGWNVAQLNVARAVAPYDSPEMAGFMDRLSEINSLGEAAPGFVWRLTNAEGNTIGLGAHPDPLVVFNLSLWKSVEDLYNFTYHSGHMEVFRRRREWFGRLGSASIAMWWIPEGEIPGMDDGLRRLALIDALGPTAEAFDFKRRFAPPNER
jgi:hypothetical protein